MITGNLSIQIFGGKKTHCSTIGTPPKILLKKLDIYFKNIFKNIILGFCQLGK